MITAMNSSGSLLVVGSMESFVGDQGVRSFFCGFDSSRDMKPCSNLLDIFFGRNVPYFGCSMLLSKEIKPYLLPFYSKKISHDIWITFVASRYSFISHLEEIVTFRRIHGNNLTNSGRGFFAKLRTRYMWSLALLNIVNRR